MTLTEALNSRKESEEENEKTKCKQAIDYNEYHVAAITEDGTLLISKHWCEVAGLKIKLVNLFGEHKSD